MVVTLTPKALSNGAAPRVTPQMVTVLEPDAISAVAERTMVVPERVCDTDSPEFAVVPLVTAVTKPLGSIIMMLLLGGTVEAVVKPTTILRLTTPPIRSAGSMERVGEVTTPPIATVGPDANRSTLEETETPV